jgi:hypothetical protein
VALVEDLAQLERMLGDLVTRYEQYFIGLEKREPIQLLADVEKLVRRHAGTPINNTMYKHRFNAQVARLNTYREHWNRILRLIEDGKYSRDRFIRDLRQRQHGCLGRVRSDEDAVKPSREAELDRVYQELREARRSCHLPVDKLTREMVAATLQKHKPALVARLGTDDLTYRVVIENGKPKIKASLRKET